MKSNDNLIKIVFGFVIFLFSLAFAYFTSSYLKNQDILNYWLSLSIFGGSYIFCGIIATRVYPISLGFLLSADIILINILMANFGDMPSAMKALTVGVILILLYLIAWAMFSEEQNTDTPSSPINDNVNLNPPQA